MAVSEPYTDEAGEVVVRVAKELEYQDAIREGRPAVSMQWPVRQIEVIGLFLEDDGETHELSQEPQEELLGAEARPGGEEAQEGVEPWSWWRRVFGG